MSAYGEIAMLKWDIHAYGDSARSYSGGWVSDYFLDLEDFVDGELRYKVYDELLEMTYDE